MTELHIAYLETEVGTLKIVGDRDHIQEIEFVKNSEDQSRTQPHTDENEPEPCRSLPLPPSLKQCITQLSEYFRGERMEFSLPLSPRGTPFQKKVWAQLQKIPYGKTASYKNVAEAIGNPKGTRAVGGANGKNPISIVVPCHRVIAHNGSIGGYGGGLWRKKWLLEHEHKILSIKK